MQKGMFRHVKRDEAERLIQERRLRRWQIAEQLGLSEATVTKWAKAMGIERIRGTGPTRRKAVQS